MLLTPPLLPRASSLRHCTASRSMMWSLFDACSLITYQLQPSALSLSGFYPLFFSFQRSFVAIFIRMWRRRNGRGCRGDSALLVQLTRASGEAVSAEAPACHLDRVTAGIEEELMGRHATSQNAAWHRLESEEVGARRICLFFCLATEFSRDLCPPALRCPLGYRRAGPVVLNLC